jgi:hypothetical protein
LFSGLLICIKVAAGFPVYYVSSLFTRKRAMCSSIDTECSAPAVPDVVEKSYGLYPGLASFSSDYNAEDYGNWVEQSNGDPLPAPLALYIQDSCEGDSPPVRGADISSSRRFNAIERELTLQGALFDSDRPVQRFICSASISTDWTDDQLYRLVSVVQESFSVNQTGIANWCACMWMNWVWRSNRHVS